MNDPSRGLAANVIETHTALVFFVGDRVYKLKKAEDLGFLDHRTREARLRSCRDEVELNSRLAPDVYLDVLDVSASDGRVLDHLVAMRRMPDERRLSRCVERGEDLEPALRSIGHSVETLHERSSRSEHHDANARRDAVRARWTQSFEQVAAVSGMLEDDSVVRRIQDLVHQYLAGRTELFDQRIDDGRIRDGHGDLQADDIFVLDDGPRVLDCIEFGADYRWGDVLADVAFLAMDLERLGRPDLGARFLALHRELTGDRWPQSLAHHYVAYRALVRAKVTMLRHAQHDEPFGHDVDALLELAVRHLEAGQVRLVLIGGLPGTGKSTLATNVGDALGAVVLRTDEIRRRLATTDTDYSPGAVAAVYRKMLLEAEHLLGLGESVVLDASWSDAAERDLARTVALRCQGALGEIECRAPRAEAAARIDRRLRLGEDPSEATTAVATSMAARFAPWPEADRLSTTAAPELVARAALTTLGVHSR
ncbi:AAA family ATPase [soil metagenome]